MGLHLHPYIRLGSRRGGQSYYRTVSVAGCARLPAKLSHFEKFLLTGIVIAFINQSPSRRSTRITKSNRSNARQQFKSTSNLSNFICVSAPIVNKARPCSNHAARIAPSIRLASGCSSRRRAVILLCTGPVCDPFFSAYKGDSFRRLLFDVIDGCASANETACHQCPGIHTAYQTWRAIGGT